VYVLAVLDAHGAHIDEVNVEREVIDRVDQSCLTQGDLEHLGHASAVAREQCAFDMNQGYVAFKTYLGGIEQRSLWASLRCHGHLEVGADTEAEHSVL